jgi:WD40 repeat protein
VAEDPKPTVDRRAPTADPAMGTMQVPAGHSVPDTGPPVMPTMRGDAPPMSIPPAMPTPGDDAIAPSMPTMIGDAASATSAPPAMPPARYQLGAEIARGGMGRVVEATDTTLGRVVAFKEALSRDPDSLKRFARETRITARLEHPSIVPVHDGGVGPNGSPFYVMRKISGRPLESLVATGETIEQRLALVPYMVAASQAIAHAHERGIVHRDIKPSNILVGDLGETIVIDWGLAKVIGEVEEPGMPVLVDPSDSLKTRVGIVYGTPGFMAPEQLRGKQVDPRCDVYALGATLYHLLSRKPPHHAKTADEMMKAAVNSPPTPIGELVDGVPPELSTIIDKALKHDPDERYQNARELAEDLDRFVKGQLVASHHYTPAEKLRRFVKKHKVPVIAVSLAVLALVVGGIVAYVRVANARDRADAAADAARKDKRTAELQRELAEERNDKLTLSQARTVVDSNPTLAVAMIKPLAAKHWREVRSIAAAARASGVAFSLPASSVMESLEMSRDGTLALAAGEDGVVRIYDLEKRTSQTVVELGGKAKARFADEERKVVLWRDTRLTVLDRTGAGRRDLTVPTPIRDLELVGITAYWTDTQGAVWHLDLAGTQPVQVPFEEHITALSPSPDGRWLALSGEFHLLLYDRTQPAQPPQEVTIGTTKAIDWSGDGATFGALVDQMVLDVQISPVPTISRRLTVGERTFVAASRDLVYTVGPTGVAMIGPDSAGPRHQLTGVPVGLAESRGHTIVAGSEDGIAVLSDLGDHSLSVPTGRLTTLAASPRSPFILGAIEGRLLVWNLDEIEPKQIAARATSAMFVGSDAVIATFVDGPAQWIDLTTGTSRPLGAWPSIVSSASAPGGQLAAIVDLAHHGVLVSSTKEPVALAGQVDAVGFVTDHQLLLATTNGTVDLLDTTSGDRAPLVVGKDALTGLGWSRSGAPWVACGFKDLTLWRKQLGGRDEATSHLPKAPTSSLTVTGDGSVWFATDKELLAWRPDDTIAHHATLPRPIIEIGEAGPGYLVAFTDGDGAFLVELGAPDRVTPIEQPLGRTLSSMSADSGLLVTVARGALHLLDPRVDRQAWRYAGAANISFTSPRISNDGRRILAQTATGLLVWKLDLPGGTDATAAASTAAWLEQLTNAVIGSGPKSLDWR